MRFLQPTSWQEALAGKAEHPEAVPVAGGTDVMVDLNFGRDRPPALLDLTRVRELAEWRVEGGQLRLGAGVDYTRVITEVDGLLPGLAAASRTVGSPQIRNRGTVGGNLASASPAGDTLPPLLAGNAQVEVASIARGPRVMRVEDFLTGPGRCALAADELISAVLVPCAAGPQQFSKIGSRNAMVISVCSLALALDPVRQSVTAAIGSAAPTALRASRAEVFIADDLADRGLWESRKPIPETTRHRFAELVATAASPVDDVRGTASYRRHALSVLAGRALTWAWDELRRRTT